jgi:hypothetical protein
VIPLHLRHPQEVRDQVRPAPCERETGRLLVLPDVPALEEARPVHGQEPAAHPAEAPENGSDYPEQRLAEPSRFRSQVLEHSSDAPAVLHLLGSDGGNFPGLRAFDRTRVTLIREKRGELPGVRAPQRGSQIPKLRSFHRLDCSKPVPAPQPLPYNGTYL